MTGRVPKWLPNAISVARVLLVPIWVLAAEQVNRVAAEGAGEEPTGPRRLATAILLAIGVTDVVDGQLARRFHLESRLGATIDAIADKLTQVVSFTYLALRDGRAFATLPLWFLLLLIARDALLLAGYVAIRRRCGAVDTGHKSHGRIASLFLFVLLLVFTCGSFDAATGPLLAATAATVVLSTGLYVRRGVRQYAAAR